MNLKVYRFAESCPQELCHLNPQRCVFPPPSTFGAGACFGQTRISVGKANKRLMYVDQVLQLVYEDGSLCPSKSGLRYKSVISFVCRPEAGPTNRPMLISLDKQTCTLFFSWHTPLACEQMVSVGLGTWDIEKRMPEAWVPPGFITSFTAVHLAPQQMPSVSQPPRWSQ